MPVDAIFMYIKLIIVNKDLLREKNIIFFEAKDTAVKL